MRNGRALRRRREVEVIHYGVAIPYDPAGGSDSPPADQDFGGGGDVVSRKSEPTTPQPAAAKSSSSAPTLYGNWTPALFMPYPRSIGGIVAQVTIEENASDDLTITEHPVEQGAPIADHAFKRPSSVTIRAGWSVAGAYDLSAETGVYGLLLSWQAALLPFDVVTGKRKYTNMLMERLTVVTDQKSEYALMADITCRQVIIVGTQTTTVQTSSESPANHKEGEKTAPKKENGDQNSRNVGDGFNVERGDTPGGSSFNVERGDTAPAAPTAEKFDNIESGGGYSPEGQKLEQTVVRNTTEDGMNQKDIRKVSPATMDILKDREKTGGTLGFQASHQRLVRGVAWQQTVRFQHRGAVRSRSVFPY
jgi:hypothetical protein